ncbi:MAG: hypothetical protein RL674_1236 [Pseudomonadota bacterium]|jgi:chromosome partitioning protein
MKLVAYENSNSLAYVFSPLVLEPRQQKQRVVLADVDVPQNSAHKWLKIRRSKPLPNQDWVQATDFFDVEELKGLNKEFKFVIVDCSGKADLNSFNAIDLSDFLIVPVKPESITMMSLKETLDNCIAYSKTKPVVIVITNCSTHHLVTSTQDAKDIILKVINSYTNITLANTTISERKVWKDIVAEGKGITESKNKKAILEFNNLMKELACHWSK